MNKPTHKHDNLWNDLPFDERERLMPHMIEAQKSHIWQCKQKAIQAHNSHMLMLNDWMKNLDDGLKRATNNFNNKER